MRKIVIHNHLPRVLDAAIKWYVQIFKNANGTDHLKDITVEASSKEEAEKIAKRQVPGGKKYYAGKL